MRYKSSNNPSNFHPSLKKTNSPKITEKSLEVGKNKTDMKNVESIIKINVSLSEKISSFFSDSKLKDQINVPILKNKWFSYYD